MNSLLSFSAHDDFNHAVVLSSRPLLPGESFEVQIENVIDKWAGSIELGVTTHDPMSLDFPPVMRNVEVGTWMMTGDGVMHNNETLIEDYGYRPERMKVIVCGLLGLYGLLPSLIYIYKVGTGCSRCF